MENTEKYGMTTLLLACKGGNPFFVQMLATRDCNMLAQAPRSTSQHFSTLLSIS